MTQNWQRYLSVWLTLCVFSPARANVGLVGGNGSTLRLIHSDTVEMVSEDIDISMHGRERFGFVRYRCHFVLHNTSESSAPIQVGFPLDAPGAPKAEDGPEKGVKRYGFSVHDMGVEQYKVSLVAAPEEQRREYRQMFLWDMRLEAGETRDLWVDYGLPLSFGPRWACQKEIDSVLPLNRLCKSELGADMAVGYWFGYTTSSGLTWKGGRIGHARFTIHTQEWRSILDRLTELPGLNTRAYMEEEFGSLWFTGALPSGYQVTDDGVRWELDDFTPGPRLEYMYGVAAVPCKVRELQLPIGLSLPDLLQARQMLVAAYGGAPQDQEALAIVSQQFWYHPDPKFTEAALDPDRKAVLAELDRRIVELSR